MRRCIFMGMREMEDNQELVKKLKNIPHLGGFEKKDIQRILHFSKFKNYKAGECIIEEGSFDNWVYFLITGKVKVVKHGEDLSVLQRTGDVFGEMCIIDGSARSATVTAVDDTTCLATDISFVDSMSADDKAVFGVIFYQMLSEVLAERLRETSEELARLKEEMEVMTKQKGPVK